MAKFTQEAIEDIAQEAFKLRMHLVGTFLFGNAGVVKE